MSWESTADRKVIACFNKGAARADILNKIPAGSILKGIVDDREIGFSAISAPCDMLDLPVGARCRHG